MSQCQHCSRKTTLPLCTPCTNQLAGLLAELPWLLHELDVTITRQDRLDPQAAGHTSRNLNPINVGAMELARDICATLHQMATDVAQTHGDRRIPALVNASPSQVAYWLRNNLSALQAHPQAGRHYQAIHHLVGDTAPGAIHNIINRPDRHFAGPCPTLRGRDRDGQPQHCATMLYAHDGETFTRCPRCACDIDINQNRRRAAALADLLPAPMILEILDYLGEPVTQTTLYGWITARILKPQGFLTRKGWAKQRHRPSDPRVYSVTQARTLRMRRLTHQNRSEQVISSN